MHDRMVELDRHEAMVARTCPIASTRTFCSSCRRGSAHGTP